MDDYESFGDSSVNVNDRALAAVADFIHEVQPEGMVQKFVLIVETIEADGKYISAFVAPGQKRWDSMGMLDYALNLERNTVLAVDGDDDA